MTDTKKPIKTANEIIGDLLCEGGLIEYPNKEGEVADGNFRLCYSSFPLVYSSSDGIPTIQVTNTQESQDTPNAPNAQTITNTQVTMSKDTQRACLITLFGGRGNDAALAFNQPTIAVTTRGLKKECIIDESLDKIAEIQSFLTGYRWQCKNDEDAENKGYYYLLITNDSDIVDLGHDERRQYQCLFRCKYQPFNPGNRQGW